MDNLKTGATNMTQKSIVFVKSNWMVIVAVLLFAGLGYYMYNNYYYLYKL